MTSQNISEGCINLGVNLLYRAVKDKSEQAVITLASFLISGEDYIQAINVLNEGLTFAVNKHEIYLLLAHLLMTFPSIFILIMII